VSSGESDQVGRLTFRIYSYGKDGAPDADIVTGVWASFESDLVIQDESYIQVKW